MAPAKQTTAWKIMVYLAADSGLYKNSETTMKQIRSACPFHEAPVLVHWDGPTEKHSRRYFAQGGRLKEAEDKIFSTVRSRYDKLSSFLEWSFEQCPSEKSALILWGHGDGVDHSYFYSTRLRKRPIEGVMNERDANKYLGDSQLNELLLKSKSAHRTIDFLGFDACLMGMVEVGYQLRGAISSMVASERVIPNASWPYAEILKDIDRNPGMNPLEFGIVCVRRFNESYARGRRTIDVSLACFDLGQCDVLTATMTKLVEELGNATSEKRNWKAIRTAADRARYVDEPDYIDIGTFCVELMKCFEVSSPVALAAQEALESFGKKRFIVYRSSTRPAEFRSSAGVTIYFPLPKLASAKEGGNESKTKTKAKTKITNFEIDWAKYCALDFPNNTRWGSFLDNFLKLEVGG